MVFDETGAFDAFRVPGVGGSSLDLAKQGQALSKTYAAGAFITEVETHTYHLDLVTNQLMHYDGWQSDIPLVDDVVGLRFRYFGDPIPRHHQDRRLARRTVSSHRSAPPS